MYKVFALLILLFPLGIKAQSTIEGVVTDTKGNPIFGATLSVIGTAKGTYSGMEGKFKMEGLIYSDSLKVSAMGYASKNIPIEDWIPQFTIQLKSTSINLADIMVVARHPISENFEVDRMEPIEIYKTPGSNADPLRAVILQSYATNAHESAVPELRGSAPNRSQVIFNQAPLRNPVRGSNLITGAGSYSILNTEIIDAQYVFPSNPPLTFGNTSGGLIQIETLKKLEQDETQVSLGLLHTSLLTKQKLGSSQNFLLAYSNYQNSIAFLELNEASLPNIKRIENLDVGVNLHLQPTKDLSVNYFGYAITESFQGNSTLFHTPIDFSQKSQRTFHILNLDQETILGSFSWNHRLDYQKQSFQSGNYKSRIDRPSYYTELHYDYGFKDVSRFQMGVVYGHDEYGVRDSLPRFFYALENEAPNFYSTHTAWRQDISYYFFNTIRLGETWNISIGVRKTYRLNTPEKPSYSSYQSSLRWDFVDGQSLLLGGGNYYSYTDIFTLISSDQIALDYTLQLKRNLFKSAIYYKKEAGNPVPRDINSQGQIQNTELWGWEFSWASSVSDHWDFTLANTLLHRNRSLLFEGQSHKDRHPWGYYPKISLAYQQKSWSANMNIVMARGTTYTPITDSRSSPIPGVREPLYSNPHGVRLPNYISVNIGIYRFFELLDSHVLLYGSINNALNRKNPTGVYYNRDYTQTFFQQGAGRILYVGTVWYL